MYTPRLVSMVVSLVLVTNELHAYMQTMQVRILCQYTLCATEDARSRNYLVIEPPHMIRRRDLTSAPTSHISHRMIGA